MKAAASQHRPLSRDSVSLVDDLLPICDFVGILLAACAATLAFGLWTPSPGATFWAFWSDGFRPAFAAAVLAPFILCDRAFTAFAVTGQPMALVHCYLARFVIFAGVVAAVGLASPYLDRPPQVWLALWLTFSLLITVLVRWLVVAGLQGLERNGVLVERIAIVGAGPVADRLIDHLRQRRGCRAEIVGIFDDAPSAASGCISHTSGSIADLLEIGKARSMDWILLAKPDADESAIQVLVHRLMALAVPIGMCPDDPERRAVSEVVRHLGGGLAVTLLADRPQERWRPVVARMELVLPAWIVTLLCLPLSGFRLARFAMRRRSRIGAATPQCAISQSRNTTP